MFAIQFLLTYYRGNMLLVTFHGNEGTNDIYGYSTKDDTPETPDTAAALAGMPGGVNLDHLRVMTHPRLCRAARHSQPPGTTHPVLPVGLGQPLVPMKITGNRSAGAAASAGRSLVLWRKRMGNRIYCVTLLAL